MLDSQWLIIGYGNIGRRIARQVKGFEGQVTGIRRRQLADEYADQVGALAEVPDLLPRADVVVLACALNEETRGLADAVFFSQMKLDALLVNIGRGDLVDEAALLAALDKGELDYAILDVFQTEPLPEDSPIWDHGRIQVTPHSSNRGELTGTRFDELFVANLGRYLAGEPVTNRVLPGTF
jgi:phosphoglycerate dehydrogenase-like enzyme